MLFPGLSRSGSGSPVLHKGADSVGPAFCAFPRSEQPRRPGAWRAHSPQVGWGILSPPLSQLLGFLDAQREHRLTCAVCLLWGIDPWLQSSWQMSVVQDSRKTWLATGSLLTVWWRMLVSGAEIAPYLLGCRMPASLPPVGGGASLQLASSPLVFTQSFVL